MTGNRLKAIRDRHGLTQSELAAKLDRSVQWIAANEQRGARQIADGLAYRVENFDKQRRAVKCD